MFFHFKYKSLNVTPSCDRTLSLSFAHFGYCLIEFCRSVCTASLPSRLLRRVQGRLLYGAKWWWRIGPVMTRPLSLHLTVWLCTSAAECRHLWDSHLLSGIQMQSRTALTTLTRTHAHTDTRAPFPLVQKRVSSGSCQECSHRRQ